MSNSKTTKEMLSSMLECCSRADDASTLIVGSCWAEMLGGVRTFAGKVVVVLLTLESDDVWVGSMGSEEPWEHVTPQKACGLKLEALLREGNIFVSIGEDAGSIGEIVCLSFGSEEARSRYAELLTCCDKFLALENGLLFIWDRGSAQACLSKPHSKLEDGVVDMLIREYGLAVRYDMLLEKIASLRSRADNLVALKRDFEVLEKRLKAR